MNTWFERIQNEKKELDDKIVKLESFLQKAPSDFSVSIHSLYLLSEQLVIMKRYSYILGERIKDGENK